MANDPPYDWPDYRSTALRAPKRPLVPLPTTETELTGPAFGHESVGELDAGSVFVNDMVVSDPRFPFGGVKASGYGREGSLYGLDEYLHTKYLLQGNLA